MPRQLPPLKSLEGFEAAARLGSFAAAAEELSLSQSAISHQVRALEEALDQPLFRRIYRQVVLTDAGKDFYRTVRQVLRTLREGVDRLAPYHKPNSVILYCDHTFAECWLMPRFADLVADVPSADVWLDSRGGEVDLDLTEVDILVTANELEEDEEPGELLLTLDYRPFSAPALAARIAGELAPQDAMTHRLLHLEGKIGWAAWFDLKERATRETWLTAGPTFADARSLLLAAGQGLGIALAPVQFAQPMVDAGTLLPIGTRRWREATRYRMIVNHDPADAAYVLPVRDWLRQRSRRP